MTQSLSDKKYQYFGSARCYYSGVPISSGTAWTWLGFSGTNTGFGAHGNTESQRIMLISSGTSFMQWSLNSGTSINGELWGGNAVALDGVAVSGLWVRSKTDTQKFQIFSW